jgi:AhpD family alkylhydroperoxidase
MKPNNTGDAVSKEALYQRKRNHLQPRLNYMELAPGVYRAMSDLEYYVHSCGIDPSLLELVKLRSSEINGCAYCIDMHSKDARAGGETEQRLYVLSTWRETPFLTDRERAALAWAEAVTQVSEAHVPDEVYELARRHFSEKELVDLTFAIVAINGWNRLAISFRTVPGTSQSAHRNTAGASEKKESD